MSSAFSPKHLFKLDGKRALVTGGSSGIGAGIVEAFAYAGADVAFTYSSAFDQGLRNPNASAQLIDTVSGSGRELVGIDLDLNASREILNLAFERVGRVDILVLNASVQVPQTVSELTEDAMSQQLRVNFENTFWLLNRFVAPMVSRGWGRVIAISSVQELQPRETMPVYAATKAALGNTMRNLAKAHAEDGVTFNTILPGLIETTRNTWREERPDEWDKLGRNVNPMGRPGTVEEVAGAALLFASPASGFTTGAELLVAGGGHLP